MLRQLGSKSLKQSAVSSYTRQYAATSLWSTSARRWYSAAAEEQDLVVIGGGPGGYVAAIKAGQLGMKVTCVEKRGKLGGTCLNVGCIPSKALLHSSHMYDEAKNRFAHHGIKTKGLSIDLDAMMKQKEGAVDGLTSGIEYLLKKNKVAYSKGHGEITGANEVTVALNDGGSETIKAKNILIATGSDVFGLPFLPIDEKTVVSSTGALSLTKVPKKMVVVGGGVIGLELGSVWKRLGAEVTVVEFLDRIAFPCDNEVAKEFKKLLTKQGMKFMMNTKVTGASIDPKTGASTLTVEAAKGGKEETIEADVVLVSIGRRPYIDGLGLDKVGVKYDQKSGMIDTDDQWRTNVPSIRAIGDCIKGPMLAHKAEEEGIAAVENIMNSDAGHVPYNAIPSVIYTHPEVAWVGLTEEEAKEKGIDYAVGRFPFKANSRARTNDDADGFVKIVTDKKSDKLYGVHIIGTNAGELIAEPVMAVTWDASSEDLARTCHAHPTLSEAIKEAAMDAHDKPIHF